MEHDHPKQQLCGAHETQFVDLMFDEAFSVQIHFFHDSAQSNRETLSRS
jgi:hypothetical protein